MKAIKEGVGGGADSSELTARLIDVRKNKSAVTNDSDDEPGNGTMPEYAGVNTNGSASIDGANLKVKPTTDGYYSAASGLLVPQGTVASLGGVTAAKLATGQSALGINGAYKGLGDATAADVLATKKFSSANLSNTQGTIPVAPSENGAKDVHYYGASMTGKDRNVFVMVPRGFYNDTWVGFKEPNLRPDKVANGITLNANGISGKPMVGTYKGRGNAGTGQVLPGYTFSTASLDNASGSMPTLGGQSVTPQTYAQSIASSGKYLTGNVSIGGVPLPPAHVLMNGYRYWVGGNYVDGTFQGYTTDPLYIVKASGFTDALQTKGVTATYFSPHITSSSSEQSYGSANNAGKSFINLGFVGLREKQGGRIVVRLNQTVDLTSYKYIKSDYIGRGGYAMSGTGYVGISQSPNITDMNLGARASVYIPTSNSVVQSGTLISDVSSITGAWFIYVAVDFVYGTGYTNQNLVFNVGNLFLTNA